MEIKVTSIKRAGWALSGSLITSDIESINKTN